MFITTTLRDVVAQRLQTNTALLATGAEIVTRQRGQLPSQIAEVLATLKLGIVVFPAIVEKANPNTAPLYLERLSLTIRVTESALNDTDYEAEQIAEMLHTYLHDWQLPPEIPGRPMLFSDPEPMTPGQMSEVGPFFIDCTFFTQGIVAPKA